MKKKVLLFAVCFLILTTNAFAELTQSDLQEIDKLIQASETRIKEYVDLKINALDVKLSGQINALDAKLTGEINALDGRLAQVYGFVIASVALIAVSCRVAANSCRETRKRDARTRTNELRRCNKR